MTTHRFPLIAIMDEVNGENKENNNDGDGCEEEDDE
jgi:hypothetical protein